VEERTSIATQITGNAYATPPTAISNRNTSQFRILHNQNKTRQIPNPNRNKNYQVAIEFPPRNTFIHRNTFSNHGSAIRNRTQLTETKGRP
jgi:hypothetical protein